MKAYNQIGIINSFQSLGTLDGPGVRFVIFLQGCNLRCSCCHNPETWSLKGNILLNANQVINKAKNYQTYFNEKGGITISGGEPLIQSKFVSELFECAHENNIRTCLDTSGSILNDEVKEVLKHTDYVLLDIKYMSEKLYLKHVGISYQKIIEFLEYLNLKNISTCLRQVIIPSINDNEENIKQLNFLANKYDCVKKVELLPFKKLCLSKYQNLNIDFPFKDIDEATNQKIDSLMKLIEKK